MFPERAAGKMCTQELSLDISQAVTIAFVRMVFAPKLNAFAKEFDLLPCISQTADIESIRFGTTEGGLSVLQIQYQEDTFPFVTITTELQYDPVADMCLVEQWTDDFQKRRWPVGVHLNFGQIVDFIRNPVEYIGRVSVDASDGPDFFQSY